MIAISQQADTSCVRFGQSDERPSWQVEFLKFLPAIRRHARVSFRHLDREARAEATQDVIAHALDAFLRLWERGRGELAYPTPLAAYAVRRVRDGRRIGGHRNVRDIASRVCQRRNGIRLDRLDEYDEISGRWKEIIVSDRRATPAEIAAARIDFADWLETLAPQHRRIAELLALGEKTCTVARLVRLSSGRISQVKRELYMHWRAFHGEAGSMSSSLHEPIRGARA
jgi:hypothetical protein